MICKKCGKEVKEQTPFCPFCGSEMADRNEPASVYAAQPKITFTAPGAKKETNNTGSSVPKTTWTPPSSPLAKAKPIDSHAPFSNINMRVIVIVFAAVIGLAVLCFGGYFVYDRINDTPKKYSTPSKAETTPKPSAPTSTPKSTSKPAYAAISDSEIINIIDSNVSDAQVGIYVKNLSTGYTYGFNERTVLPASAMSYVPIMLSAIDYAKSNRINLDSEGMTFYYMPNGMEKPNSANDDGQFFTIRDYIETVAKYGDNNRSNALVDWIGNDDYKSGFSYINNQISKRGYNQTSINRKIYIKDDYIDKTAAPNTTCAYDIANLFNDFLSNGYLGDRNYVKSVCKYTDIKGQPMGIRKAFSSSNYSISNHYAINTLTQNEVASISNGKNEIVVSVLCTLSDNDPNTTTDEEARSRMINQLFSYIIQNQLAY